MAAHLTPDLEIWSTKMREIHFINVVPSKRRGIFPFYFAIYSFVIHILLSETKLIYNHLIYSINYGMSVKHLIEILQANRNIAKFA